MKSNERRLMIIFLVLAAGMGGAILGQRLMQWDHRLDRMERDLELAKMESDTLIAQAPLWKARSEWIQQTQPVAASGFDAGNNLVESLRQAAEAGGIDINKTETEEVVQTGYYRQYGVKFTATGELPKILGWIHATLNPSEFYVVPRLRITPDKGESQKVIAQVTFQRRYTPEFASNASGAPNAAQPQAPAPVQPQGVVNP